MVGKPIRNYGSLLNVYAIFLKFHNTKLSAMTVCGLLPNRRDLPSRYRLETPVSDPPLALPFNRFSTGCAVMYIAPTAAEPLLR